MNPEYIIPLTVVGLSLVGTILKIWGANKRLTDTVEVLADEVEKHGNLFPVPGKSLKGEIQLAAKAKGVETKLAPIVKKAETKAKNQGPL